MAMNKNNDAAIAIAKNIPYSPYKLRPIVNVLRNKSVLYALQWLKVYNNQRTIPLKKVIESALSNMLVNQNNDPKLRDGLLVKSIIISEIKVDQGPIKKYFNPGAQGRATVLRKRYCHISVEVKSNKINTGDKVTINNKINIVSSVSDNNQIVV